MTTEKLLSSKKAFLFDLDGTLYLGKKLLKGSVELIRALEQFNRQVFFFTNNSSRSDRDYVKKLKAFGFPVQLDQVVMSTHTVIRQLQKDRQSRVFCLGTPAMKRMLKRSGIEHSENPSSVVIGFDKTLTYQKWLKACRLIHAGLPYYVAHPDFFCPTDEGPEPDCGAIALATEKATRKKPRAVLGKPHLSMIKEVKRRGSFKNSEMLLIGDRLQTDIKMAQSAKIDSILVLSGESQRRDVSKGAARPSLVLRDVSELLKKIKKLKDS